MTDSIRAYQIAVPDSAIELLQKKLALATFPGETEISNNPSYGAGLDDIKRLVESWKNTFDWRKVEAKLNKFPHFETTVSIEGHEDNLRLHFIHQKSERQDSIPLLFCHGWPGSFIEVTKILPLLTSGEGDEPTFHVVAPSLPNYGFSQRTSKAGFALPQYAEACHKLMLKLGYEKYATQGGDLGFPITRAMAVRYPKHIIALHTNMVITKQPSIWSTPFLVLQYLMGRYTPAEKAGLERTQNYFNNMSGYSNIQGTAPHTPGFSLVDSPVGLLAWIYEKLRDWTDDYPWTDEEVLTWISIYAFSDAGPDATLRVYYEMSRSHGAPDRNLTALDPYVKWNDVPIGMSLFPRDLIVLPSAWAKTLGPVVFEKRHEDGGHFASWEKPELLASDVKAMFRKIGHVKR